MFLPGIDTWLFDSFYLVFLAQCGNLRGYLTLLKELFMDNKWVHLVTLFKECSRIPLLHNL